jgi:hypothetical protein
MEAEKRHARFRIAAEYFERQILPRWKHPISSAAVSTKI